jgi:FtsX-like permease family
VAANPIEALELGRGQLELDIERGGAQPAGVVLSAPWAAARFACNGSDDTAQQWARFADCLSNCLPQPQSLCRTVYPALNRSALDAAARATYTDYQDLIVSEAYRDFSGIDVQTPLLLALATRDPDTSLGNDQVRLGKARAMAAMLPGFPLFSSYSQAAWFAPALTSMRAFSRLLGAVSQSLADDIADGTAVYKNADGDITGTMAAPSSSTSPPTPSPSSNASSSEATWRGGNGTAGGAGWGVEVRPAEALLAGNVSFLADGAVATFGRVAVADGEPATAVSWDRGQCLVVDAVRLWLGDNSTRPPAVPPAQPTAFAFTLQSRSGPGGTLVDHAVSASAAAVVGGDAGVLLTLALAEPFSARLWSLGVRDRARAGRPRAEWDVAEVQVHAAPGGVCASGGGGDEEPDVPKARLLVKLRPGISLRQTREVVNGVRSLLPDDSFSVVSTNELLLTTESAIFGLTFFFDFIAVVVGVLIFLASVVSWTATVHENSVEVGILRALGLSSAETTRVFVYEALAVVLASFLLGAAVGFAIAAAITLQFNLFTEMPFILRVPWVTLLLTFLIFVATAIFAAGIPARTIATAKIASVVKGRLDAAKD